MTLTLTLTSEQEALLRSEAQQRGLPMVEYALRRLLGELPSASTDEGTRLAAIDAAMGALAGLGLASEALMREKQEEIQREEQRWQERYGLCSWLAEGTRSPPR